MHLCMGWRHQQTCLYPQPQPSTSGRLGMVDEASKDLRALLCYTATSSAHLQ